MVGRSHNGLVKRGSSVSVNLFQRLFHLQQVISEILIEIVLVVEVDDTDFVFGIARTYQVERGLVHFVAFFAHRPGIVDHNGHRDRNVFVVKRDDGLRLPILEYGECVLVEVGNDALVVVDDRGMEQDFVDILANDEVATVAGGRRRSLLFLRWRRISLAGATRRRQ